MGYRIFGKNYIIRTLWILEVRLMDKAKMTLLLKGRLFDSHNTFSLNETLSGMEIKDLNPMLEKNAFIYAISGKIDKMNFSFTADNSRAFGKMILLYHGLDIAVKNKRADYTTAGYFHNCQY